MKKLAFIAKIKTKPGKRDQVWKLWKEHVKPHVEDKESLEVCCYCFNIDDPDTIILFEIFSDPEDFKAASQSDWYAKYQEHVKPYIASAPELTFAEPIWAKGVEFL